MPVPLFFLARQEGFEPPTYGFVVRHSIQLSYWRLSVWTRGPSPAHTIPGLGGDDKRFSTPRAHPGPQLWSSSSIFCSPGRMEAPA